MPTPTRLRPVAALWALLSLLLLPALAAADHSDVQALAALDAAVGEAIVAGDFEALERLYAPDFVFVAPDGRRVDRAARMESFRSGRLRYLETAHSELEIEVGGDLALVTGLAHTRYVANGNAAEGDYRYSSVWRRAGDSWQVISTQATRVADAAQSAPSGVAALGWLAGHWRGEQDGTASEEFWTSPAGGGLVGLHKDVRPGRAPAFEFLRIVEGEAGEPCYLASPGGAPPVRFCAVEQDAARVVFENLAHDFPQRILYSLEPDGALRARVEGPGEQGVESLEWVWRRAGP